MKKTFILLLMLLSCLFVGLNAKDNTQIVEVEAVAPSNYYSTVDTSSKQKLLSSLTSIISSGHKDRGYGALWTAYHTTDVRPGTNYIWDMYSSKDFVVGGSKQGANYKGEGDGYNREHSIPKSWFNDKAPMINDVHHIYPTDGYVNNIRSNYPFGKVGSASYTSSNGSKLGNSVHPLYSGTVFEPIDEYKGDFARTYFYMATRYSSDIKNWTEQGKKVFSASFPYLTNYAISLFMEWHKNDPVSPKETSRNDAAYQFQGNRNPYIDHPEYANFIWGDATSVDPGTPTPPVQTTYKVNYVVQNGVSFNYSDSTGYTSGAKVKEPTVPPTLSGYEFGGWYKDGEYKTKWNFATDTITSNLTLYAKFDKIVAKSFSEIFNTLSIKSQLTFNVKETTSTSVPVEATSIINSFSGVGEYKGADIDMSTVSNVDTSLFDFQYKANGSGLSFVNTSEIRLYGNNSGGYLEITAKNGIKIKKIEFTGSGATGDLTIASDGSSARYHNNNGAGSGNQVKIKTITITYETSGTGTSYELINGSLYLNYVLLLSQSNYDLYIKDGKELELYINNEEVGYEIIQVNNEYRIQFSIKIDNYTTLYVPKITYEGQTITIDGYSAKSLANFYLQSLASDSLVKKYKACLESIIQ